MFGYCTFNSSYKKCYPLQPPQFFISSLRILAALVGVVEFTKVDEEVGGTNHYVLKEREKTMKRVQKLKNEMIPAEREKIKAAYKKEVANKKKKAEEAAFKASSTSKKAKSYAKKGRRGYKE